MPVVSVILPFRDAEATILDAAQGILRQQFRDLELIAVDEDPVMDRSHPWRGWLILVSDSMETN